MTNPIQITWMDSRGVTSEWERLSDMEPQGLCKVKSVGWLVGEGDDYIMLAAHVGVEHDGDNQVCGVMYIAKSCIFDTKKLKGKHNA